MDRAMARMTGYPTRELLNCPKVFPGDHPCGEFLAYRLLFADGVRAIGFESGWWPRSDRVMTYRAAERVVAGYAPTRRGDVPPRWTDSDGVLHDEGRWTRSRLAIPWPVRVKCPRCGLVTKFDP